MDFGSQDEYLDKISEIYKRAVTEILNEKLPPFTYTIKEGGVGHLEITIQINPNDFLSDVAPRSSIKLYLDSPLMSGTAMDSDNILNGIRSLKYHGWLNKVESFIDEKEGRHIKKISFTVSPESLPKLKQDAASYTRSTRGSVGSSESNDFDLSHVYSLFMTEPGPKQEEIDGFGKKIKLLAERRGILEIFNSLVVPAQHKEINQDELNKVIDEISTDSPTTDSVKAARSMFRELLVLSQEGRPSYVNLSHDLSRLADALLKKYGTPTEIEQAFRKADVKAI